MIAYNIGNLKIMIVTDWQPDPMGGQAIISNTYSLMPGEGIDLDILGVEVEIPKKEESDK